MKNPLKCRSEQGIRVMHDHSNDHDQFLKKWSKPSKYLDHLINFNYHCYSLDWFVDIQLESRISHFWRQFSAKLNSVDENLEARQSDVGTRLLRRPTQPHLQVARQTGQSLDAVVERHVEGVDLLEHFACERLVGAGMRVRGGGPGDGYRDE